MVLEFKTGKMDLRIEKEPLPKEQLVMRLNYAAGLIAEILGFALAFVVVLCLAGVLR